MTNNYISVLKMSPKGVHRHLYVMDFFITIKKSITLQVSMNTFRAHFKNTNIIVSHNEFRKIIN